MKENTTFCEILFVFESHIWLFWENVLGKAKSAKKHAYSLSQPQKPSSVHFLTPNPPKEAQVWVLCTTWWVVGIIVYNTTANQHQISAYPWKNHMNKHLQEQRALPLERICSASKSSKVGVKKYKKRVFFSTLWSNIVTPPLTSKNWCFRG